VIFALLKYYLIVVKITVMQELALIPSCPAALVEAKIIVHCRIPSSLTLD
jgi:hypothetical protein